MDTSLEDLMRGLVARSFALAQVIAADVLYTQATLGLNMFAIWLVADVQTREALVFAPFLVAASLALAGKGAVLLHRKWSEYEAMENESEGIRHQNDPVWLNPMLEVAKLSKQLMAVCDIIVVLMIAPVTLWLSLSGLARNFPAFYWPVMTLTLIGCAVGVVCWALAPQSNKKQANKEPTPPNDYPYGE